MAFNLLLIILVLLVSFFLNSGYSLSTSDAVLKQDDESYFMATSYQGPSMIDFKDLTNARALVEGSRAVVNNAVSKSSSTKSSKKKKHKRKKKGSALVGIIIAIVVVTFVIICVLYFLYERHKAKKDQNIKQENATEKINGSSETHTSKPEDHV